jgi:hypothetical protein
MLEMNLLLYTTAAEGIGARLQRTIETLVPKEKLEVSWTLDRLSCRLRQPKDDFTIAVLLAASRNDLADILSIHDLLCDIRIILILPDRENDTIAWGHSLQPRYLSYIDSDFTDVAAVLGKMMRQCIFTKQR